MNKFATLIAICICALFVATRADACGTQQSPQSMAELKAFLSGKWSGAGQFASGKTIAADVSFEPVAGGRWLSYSHADRPPGRYRAQGSWGYTRSGEFIMTLHDSGGGARVFSSQGWCDDRVVFDLRQNLSQPQHTQKAAKRQRFIFERIADDRLKMTYLSGAEDGGWRMVDFVEFDRNGAAANEPTVFAPGVISGPAHDAAPAFAPDGDTVYFGRSNATQSTILVSRRSTHGRWSAPRVAPFSGQWNDMEPAMSPDGSFLIFVSNRPSPDSDDPVEAFYSGRANPGGRLWRIDRDGNGWSTPRLLPAHVNLTTSTFAPSIAADGSVYFMSADGKGGRFHLYRSQFQDGQYLAAQALPFNAGNASDVDPAVAPDESFLVFGSGRLAGRSIDLFVVFREDQDWGHPMHLGDAINTPGSDAEPRLSPDGRDLYFSSERVVPVSFPRTPDRAADDVARMQWDNGNYNIWRVPLAPLIKRAGGK